jgi:hypothetical protein
MKKTILAGILLLSFFFGEAHYLNPLCWSGGNYSFSATVGVSGNATITLIKANGEPVVGSGAYSVVVNVVGSEVTFSVPQPNKATIVRVKIVWSDGYVNTAYSNTNECSRLPIKIVDMAAEKDGDNIHVVFKTLEEINVKYYKISISTDNGVTWVDRWLQFLGDTPKGTYSVTFKK